jgi:hypothetical protein
MVDRDLLLRKLADLDQYLGQVSEYRDITTPCGAEARAFRRREEAPPLNE